MRIEGRCHCGNLGFALETAHPGRPSGRVSATAPSAARTASRCVSDPAGRAAIRVSDPARLVRYRFGLRTAEFLVCGTCGVYIGAYAEEEGQGLATLNLRATSHHGRPGASSPTVRRRPANAAPAAGARWTPTELRLGALPPGADPAP